MPEAPPSRIVTDKWLSKSGPRVVPMEATVQSRPATKIEPLDAAEGDLFPSEGSEVVKVSVFPVDASLKTSVPPPPASPVSPPPAASRVNWRNGVLVVLASAVIGQAALMAYWGWSGRPLPWSAPQTGTVAINSEPAGAAVSIDGVERGQTPLTLALEAGAHHVVVGSGERSRAQSVNVAGGGEASIHVQLPAESTAPIVHKAALQIATEPTGARVWVDGEPHGVAPITVSDLAAGDHTVVVRGASGTPITRTVSVQEGATASLIVTMPASPALASGWLSISSPVSLQVMENGALLGTTDMSRIMMPAGEHEIELVNASLNFSLPRTVTIVTGRTASVVVTPPRGSLSVNALPWAEVWIDGQRVGETPIGNYSLPIGVHEVVFRHPELGQQRKTVTVAAQGAARIGVDMTKP